MSKHQQIKDHLSFSELKSFSFCEAESVATMKGIWDRSSTFSKATKEAMLIGSYVDAYFQGEEKFKEFLDENSSSFYNKLTKKEKEMGKEQGKVKALVNTAERAIDRLNQDSFFQRVYRGEKQQELWGEIYGVKFHGFADSITDRFIIDLKTLAGSIEDRTWDKDEGRKVSWIEAKKYHWQLAIYQELYRQESGKKLDTIIYGVTKQDFPVSSPIKLPQSILDYGLNEMQKYIQRYQEVIEGDIPKRCERCAYCRATKQHFMPIDYAQIFG